MTMNKLLLLSCFALFAACKVDKSTQSHLDLTGEWTFSLDTADIGEREKWFTRRLKEKVKLPGSTTTNGKGFDIDVHTPWTGSIVDSSYFTDTAYARYRKAGNIKVPFWLQPVKYYKGAAWYQKEIQIPDSAYQEGAELVIERVHWESSVWLDSIKLGTENSLSTPHRFLFKGSLKPGKHLLTIRIDNRVKTIDVGPNAHSITDHTQTNWNGMIGKMTLKPLERLRVESLQVFPDLSKKTVAVRARIVNISRPVNASLTLYATEKAGERLKDVQQTLVLTGGVNEIKIDYPMGNAVKTWDEFNPNLYTMIASLVVEGKSFGYQTDFGMREIALKGKEITLNGRPVFLRGTLESAIFPLTGYPATDVASWAKIIKTCKAYGLNHLRFHSWCPPEAAFRAADSLGMYLQIECASWANQGATIGDGKPLDDYIYRESERIVTQYGNHPSFLMMAYGNEPSGKNHVAYLRKFVETWKAKDGRRLYTTAAGWPAIAENDYNNIPEPRIQSWGEGLNSIINKQKPRSDYDWHERIAQFDIPTISHEIGQWCVYPDFKEISAYTGVMKARNLEIFRDRLRETGMDTLADQFLQASGKLQTLCYKADIEAALRTPGFAGFQLLDLHDFPGQGTALVGVLNAFWKDKGYVDGKTYRQFCNSTVPLARFPNFIYTNDQLLKVPIEIAHYGAEEKSNVSVKWQIIDEAQHVYGTGSLLMNTLRIGNNQQAGAVTMNLNEIKEAKKLTLIVTLGQYANQWDFFVFPKTLPNVNNEVYVTASFDQKARELLASGGKVLYTLRKGVLKKDKGGDIALGFSSIFWNTAWTRGQAPVTLGLLCDPQHPAFQHFPTDFHSNWQWWDAITHADAMRLDRIDPTLKPIVRVIDDWFTARPLGLVFEANIGKGKLIVSAIDLLTDRQNRPEARQLLYSLSAYMQSSSFAPKTTLQENEIAQLTHNNKF